jgi:hypothetical protein
MSSKRIGLARRVCRRGVDRRTAGGPRPFVKKTGARMLIEHDAATNAKLKKAPAYYE